MGVKNNAEKQEDNRSSEKQNSENKTPNQSVENPLGINNQGVWLDQASENPAQIHPAAILTLQRKAGNRRVQRIIRGKEDAALADNQGQLNSYVSNEIKRAQAGGQPLDKSIQRKMNESFGHDFSGVRIHKDDRSDNLNHQLNARAFTLGNNIFFSSGAYNPSTPQGRNTLNHELTHVVQQGGKSPGSGPLQLGGRETGHEKEAERVAASGPQSVNSARTGVQRQPDKILAGTTPAMRSGSSLASGIIQRAGLWDSIKTGTGNLFSGVKQKIGGLFGGNGQQQPQQPQHPQHPQPQQQQPQQQQPQQQQQQVQPPQQQQQQVQPPQQQQQQVQPPQQPALPEKPADVDEAQWEKLISYGIQDKAKWNQFSSSKKSFITTNIDESFTKSLVLEELKGENSNWPKDDNDTSILNNTKLAFVYRKSGLTFAEWNALDKIKFRKFLLNNCVGNQALMSVLAQAAKAGNWPLDENDTELQNKPKIEFIYKKSGLTFAEWNALDKTTQRKFLLGNCNGNEALMGLLAQAAKAGSWPKDDNDAPLQDKAKIEFIHKDTNLSFADWNTLDKTDERKFLLNNSAANKVLMGELARAAKAGKWPKDDSDTKFSDLARLKTIHDKLNIGFAQWNTKIITAHRKAVFDALADKELRAKILVSSAPGSWPLDGANAKMTDYASGWKKVMDAAEDISVTGWNGMPASVRGQVLAEADSTKRKNIIGQHEYEKYSKGMDISEKAFGLFDNPITDTLTGVGGLTGDILGAAGQDRAAGITGATTNFAEMGLQGISGIKSIADMTAGGIMAKNGRSKAARSIGRKRASGGFTGAIQSGLGFFGSMFGAGGNLAKGIDPDGDDSKKAQAGLGVTSGVFGSLGGLFGGALDIKSLSGSIGRSDSANKFASGLGNSAEEQKLSGVASLTSKRQNIGGRTLGLIGRGIGLLGSIHSTIASATGYAGNDITSAIFSGLGLAAGLGKAGYEYTAKADDVDVDAKSQDLIDLLKDTSKPLVAQKAAKFIHDVLKISDVDPSSSQDTWIAWVEEDVNAVKDLIKSKLSKN